MEGKMYDGTLHLRNMSVEDRKRMQQLIERCDIPVEKYHRLIEECRLDAWNILDASQRNADPRRIKIAGGRANFALKYGKPTEDKSISDLATFVLLFLTTGAKTYELQGLTWDRVDLDKGQLDITQGYCKNCNQAFMLSPTVAHHHVGAERLKRGILPRSVALPEVTVYALKRLKARHNIVQLKDRLRVVKGGQAHPWRRLGRPPKGSNIDYESTPQRRYKKSLSWNRQTYCNRHEVVPVDRWDPVLSNGVGWFREFKGNRTSGYLDYLCDTVGIPPIGLRDFQFVFAIQALKSGMSRGDVVDMLGCRYSSRAAIVIDSYSASRYPKINTDQQGPAVAAVNSSWLITSFPMTLQPKGRKRRNGEGSVYKRKDGRWAAGYRIQGKRKVLYAKTRGEVVDKLIAARKTDQDDVA